MGASVVADYAWTIVSHGPGQTPPAQALAASLVAELVDAWRHGEGPLTEHILADHPEAADQADVVLRVLHEEIQQRKKLGQRVTANELLRRFAHLADHVSALIASADNTSPAEPHFPTPGEIVGEFRLVEELGRGAQGRVFLATHRSLANRQVVLKMTPCDGEEHLSLARMQHTHIAPLYAVHDFPARHLRALVFPYLGRVTWKQMLERMQQGCEPRKAIAATDDAPAPSESYVQTICRWGACLAETLHYAHERGLVHFDVKPSNVLLTPDGEPLLLDFHLAQAPLEAGGQMPDGLGGTPGYMAPEHQRAFASLESGKTIAERVDGRADLFSLGVMLCEALGGSALPEAKPLHRANPQVSLGLSDIIRKCLAPRAEDRYGNGAELAADLQRHLANQPLRGVRNRSLVERYRKWRRRKPYVLPFGALTAAFFLAIVTLGGLWLNQRQERQHAAEMSLREGQALFHQRRYGDAVRAFARGHDVLAETASPLGKSLARHLHLARRANQAQELHQLTDALRFLYVVDSLSPRLVFILEAACQKAWTERETLLDRSQGPLEPEIEDTIRQDLLDLAICLADYRVRLRQGADADAMRREALNNLIEAEALFGASPILYRELQRHAAAIGLTELARDAERKFAQAAPASAWDHFALGRGLMRSGDFARAWDELMLAQTDQPTFWTNYCLGVCASKLHRHQDAIEAYSVCIGQHPQSAECHVQRGLAHAALGNIERAQADLDRALKLNPQVATEPITRELRDRLQK